MKIILEPIEESENFAVVHVVLYDDLDYSAILARIALKLSMEDGDITVKVQGVNTTNKPDVVIQGVEVQ